jgi:serine/threonine-protein kinase
MTEGQVLVGRYQLLSRLGSGGMGSVWVAKDLTLDADVAIKLMSQELTGSPEAAARFRREARAAASIRSSHVVQILDYGVDGKTPFIAMELLRGESLAARLERTGRLSAAETGHLLDHVGRALALAHGNGIVHRDLKPDNIFIVRESGVELGKVLDFGVARRADGLLEPGGVTTRTGAVLGTPYYMSPEQACGEAVDQRTDIWAFGVIACECLTGTRPFGGESLGALFHAVCIAAMPAPSSLGAVPPGFDQWFSRAVARDKSQRTTSVQAASEELRAICTNTALPSLGSSPGAFEGWNGRSVAGVSDAPEPHAIFQQTATASSNSVPPTTQARSRFAWIAFGAFVITLLGAVVAWRATLANQTSVTTASAPVQNPVSTIVAPIAEVPKQAPEVVPSEVVPSVASAVAVAPSGTASIASATRPAPVVRQRPTPTLPAHPSAPVAEHDQPLAPESKPPSAAPPPSNSASPVPKKPSLRTLIDDRE